MSRLFAALFLVLILRSLASQRKSSNNVSFTNFSFVSAVQKIDRDRRKKKDDVLSYCIRRLKIIRTMSAFRSSGF